MLKAICLSLTLALVATPLISANAAKKAKVATSHGFKSCGTFKYHKKGKCVDARDVTSAKKVF